MVLEGVISQALCPIIGGNGRKAAFEVMLATPAIRNLIRENKTFQIAGTMQTSRKMGMKTLDDDLYDLYNQHFIDRETALSFAQDASQLAQRLAF
jgi:twitching motility protein PilT